MSQNITFNNAVYSIPTQGQLPPWGTALDRYLVALGTYALAPSGGTFTLSADVNFGASFGLLSAYFSGRGTTASAGLLRLSKTDTIDWRNNGGSGNNTLSTDSSDNLLWNGVVVTTGTTTLADGKIWIGSGSNLPVAQTLTGDVTVTNLGVTSIGANKIVNAQINSSAAIDYTKLNLSGSIVNNDIFSSAAIALTKLATLNASIVPVTNGSGFLTSSATTTTELGYVHGVTSAIQTQIDSKQASGNYITALTGGVTASGPGSVSATVVTNANLTGPITSSGNATSIASQTGTGTTFVVDTSPTLVTPVLGAASATSITFSSTSGIIGSTTNDAAAAGSVGEFITASRTSGSPISLTSGGSTNITSMTVTAGDWDIGGIVGYIPALVLTVAQQSTSTTSATDGADTNLTYHSVTAGFVNGGRWTTGTFRYSFSTSTTVYLIASPTFTSTCTGFGTLWARRMR